MKYMIDMKHIYKIFLTFLCVACALSCSFLKEQSYTEIE